MRKVNDYIAERLRKNPHRKEEYDLIMEKAKIVKKIIEYRNEHDLTQAQLAKELGCSQQYISKIEEENFSPEELEVMDYCMDYFKDYSCGKISRYSHEEEVYKKTEGQDAISYNMAQSISLNLS